MLSEFSSWLDVMEAEAMTTKHKGDRGEYEFTRAAYDELEDCQLTNGVTVGVILEPAAQKGVWRLIMVATAGSENHSKRQVARYEALWPNAVSQSFASFLYSAAFRLCRMIESWAQGDEVWERPIS